MRWTINVGNQVSILVGFSALAVAGWLYADGVDSRLDQVLASQAELARDLGVEREPEQKLEQTPQKDHEHEEHDALHQK